MTKEELKTLRKNWKANEQELWAQQKENRRLKRGYRLKITKNITLLASPFILVGGITVGALKLTGNGFPFYRDTKEVSKVIAEEVKEDGTIVDYISYPEEIDDWKNQMIVFSPWCQNEDGVYERKCNYYDVDNLDQITLQKVKEGHFEVLKDYSIHSMTQIKNQLTEEDKYSNYQISFLKYYEDSSYQAAKDSDKILLEEMKEDGTFVASIFSKEDVDLKNQMIVFSPWCQNEDGMYERSCHYYEADNFDQMTLRKVRDGHLEVLCDYPVSSVIQLKGQLAKEDEYSSYQVSSLKYYYDQNSTISVLESEKDNIDSTKCWAISTLVAGSIGGVLTAIHMGCCGKFSIAKPNLIDTSILASEVEEQKEKYKSLKKEK